MAPGPHDPAIPGASSLDALQVLIGAERFEEAEPVLAALRRDNRGHIGLLALHGRLLRELGRPRQALEIQEALVRLRPGDFGLRFDLAEILLLLGDFPRGWREYGHRYRLAHTRELERKVQAPRWNGRPLEGRTILIHDEQGYGDTLQFLRLVPAAKARGGQVVLEVHPDLIGLARTAGGYDRLIARGEPPPPFAVHCELMSLPLALGLALTDLPGPVPYLRPDPARMRRWQTRLADLPRPWIALAWAGAGAHLRDRQRSISLPQLEPLAAARASFLSIQKGPRAAEARTPPPGLALTDLGDEIASFDDTAAILQLADLLISVDSSPVHLAGALGRPVWAMLPLNPDWRWLADRTDSPWYPSARLFRQSRRGDWAPVVDEIAAELVRLYGSASAADSGPR